MNSTELLNRIRTGQVDSLLECEFNLSVYESGVGGNLFGEYLLRSFDIPELGVAFNQDQSLQFLTVPKFSVSSINVGVSMLDTSDTFNRKRAGSLYELYARQFTYNGSLKIIPIKERPFAIISAKVDRLSDSYTPIFSLRGCRFSRPFVKYNPGSIDFTIHQFQISYESFKEVL